MYMYAGCQLCDRVVMRKVDGDQVALVAAGCTA